MDRKVVVLVAIKVFGALFYTSLLVYWSWAALEKYLDQPVSTFVTYSQADDSSHVVYPYVSFCQDQSFSTCEDLASCLKNDSEFDITDYLNQLELKANQFKTMTNQPKLMLDKTFLGDALCFTFDTSTLSGHAFFHITSAYLNSTKLSLVMIHDRNDLLDGYYLHPWFSLDKPMQLWIKMVKNITRVSTKKHPCGKFNQNTCQNLKVNQEIADNLQCKVPFLYNGKCLNEQIENYAELSICNRSSMIKALELKTKQFDECHKAIACHQVKFEVSNNEPKDAAGFWIFSQRGEVTHETSFISYDLQSLVCEVGGVVGMFLGFSGLSLNLYFAEWVGRLL